MSRANWQVTATTVYCDAVDDEVTLLVYKDWSTKCTGYSKYGEPGREIVSVLSKKSNQPKLANQSLTLEPLFTPVGIFTISALPLRVRPSCYPLHCKISLPLEKWNPNVTLPKSSEGVTYKQCHPFH